MYQISTEEEDRLIPEPLLLVIDRLEGLVVSEVSMEIGRKKQEPLSWKPRNFSIPNLRHTAGIGTHRRAQKRRMTVSATGDNSGGSTPTRGGTKSAVPKSSPIEIISSPSSDCSVSETDFDECLKLKPPQSLKLGALPNRACLGHSALSLGLEVVGCSKEMPNRDIFRSALTKFMLQGSGVNFRASSLKRFNAWNLTTCVECFRKLWHRAAFKELRESGSYLTTSSCCSPLKITSALSPSQPAFYRTSDTSLMNRSSSLRPGLKALG